ncbi:centriolin, partial [Thalassophryne amazonica]|uniref:centriolin n=1 Tax=Thalassophryne amazonica TaxID=390379 RepID=UPI0014719A63
QILANEALQRDLEGIISGLQEYLQGLRDKARCARQQVDRLQTENQALQRHLEDLQGQMDDAARIHKQDMTVQQEELLSLRQEVEALRDSQLQSSRKEAELDAELQHLREELNQQMTLGQEDNASLLKTVEKLQDQLDQSRTQHTESKTQLQQTRSQLDQTRSQLDQTRSQLDQVTAAMLDSDELGLTTGERNCRFIGPDEEQTRTNREQVQQDPDQDWASWGGAEDSEQRPEELQRLRVKLQRTRSRNRRVQRSLEAELKQSCLQLRDVQQEKDALMLQLQQQNADQQKKLRHMDRKLNQMSRDQLTSTTDQLRALNAAADLLQARRHQDAAAAPLEAQRHQNMQPDDGGFKRRSDRWRENTPTVEELRAELAAAQRLTLRLAQQLDDIRTRTTAGPCDGGPWFFFPSGHHVPCLGSQDSGLGLQYLSSPDRGQQQDHKPQTHLGCDTGAADRMNSGGRGSNSRTAAPAHLCATPPSGAAALLCGSTLTAGGAALYCNVPEHKDLAEGSAHESVHREAERLEKENKKLRLENERMQQTLRQHRNVVLVCEEVQCVEKTLLRRRAELRQADRQLLEAQRCVHAEIHKLCPNLDSR